MNEREQLISEHQNHMDSLAMQFIIAALEAKAAFCEKDGSETDAQILKLAITVLLKF